MCYKDIVFAKCMKYCMDCLKWRQCPESVRYFQGDWVLSNWQSFSLKVSSFPHQPTSADLPLLALRSLRHSCEARAPWQLQWAAHGWGESWLYVSKCIHAWKLVFHICFLCCCCVRVVNMCMSWIYLLLFVLVFFLFACPACVTLAASVFQ